MSISTVEIRAFSGPDLVELGSAGRPTIIRLNVGPKGDAGNAATVAVGTTTTGAAGTNASVTNSGTTSAAVFNFTIPRGDTGDTGATGATGAAGPNSVTSATTSDGTANLSISNVTTATATVSSLLTANHIHGNIAGTLYTHVRTGEAVVKGDPVYVSGFHNGTSQPIVSKADASNPAKMPAIGVMDATYVQNVSGANCVIAGTITSVDTDDFSVNSPVYVGNGGGFSETIGTIPQQVGIVERSNQNTGAFVVTNNKVISSADISDFASAVEAIAPNAVTSATTSDGTGQIMLDTLAVGTCNITDEVVFDNLAFTYGTGAAAAHRDALNITSADLQIESLFTLLTRQESDAGVFTANLGTATSSQDGDSLSLSALLANQRPNVYRFRNWNKNPGVSGTANAVTPVRLACAGNIYHLGSGANGASFRCGFGMVNGASAVAADANATTGRGFGWRIAWNSSTSKLEFNLWAHNGTTYVEGTGIDTGLGAGNLDGFFNIILRLASDGTVSANTWFGSSTSSSSVPSATPSVTLAGGPTSGTFANLGTPSWIAAAHSTNAPASGNSIIARISNRKLALG
jgi:hypothetical protein